MNLNLSGEVQEMLKEIARIKNISIEQAIEYVLESETSKAFNRLQSVERLVNKIAND